jgi:type II secretory pathway component PulF
MTSPLTSEPRAVTLDDLAALNREISALVASGLPLEEGLRQVARDYRGGVRSLAARLADETAAGKSLDEAIAAQGDALPPVYRAVVLAGLKSGRLAAALECFAETAARIAALRRTIGQAAVYPLLVIIVAWVMLLGVVCLVIPSYDWLGWNDRFWVTSLRMSSSTAGKLAVAVPIVLVSLAILWWRRSSRWSSGGNRTSWQRWIPGARRANQLSGQANFADLLQLLLSCRVPLPEALPLAANACGVAAIRQPAADLAAAIESGHALASQRDTIRQLPPLIRAALLSNGPDAQQRFLPALRYAAMVYRERATTWVNDFSVLAPIATTVVVGVGVVGLYTLLVWQPYTVSLDAIAEWSWR